MKKSILIAFDDSENAMRAVDFVGKHLAPDSNVVLFNVIPDTEALCTMQSPELTSYFLEQQSTFCILENKKIELLKNALKNARLRLIDYGFDRDKITIQSKKRVKGIARDIINESKSKSYDLIVLGKRGMAGIKEFFMGSISLKVVHGVNKSSVVLVD